MRHTGRDKKKRKGNALIEFALASSIILPVFLGTFQFGLGFYYYNELVNTVRAGARFGSFRNYNSPTSTPSGIAEYRDVLHL